MNIHNIYIGGWFQRTTLHLDKIYDFLNHGTSPLKKLETKKLRKLKKDMDIMNVEVKLDALEYIYIKTHNDITIRISEDGLMTLHSSCKKSQDIKKVIADLTTYYENKMSPALSYIFSLGAPIPKELANIKTIYPYFIVTQKATQKDISKILKEFNQNFS